MRRTIRGPPPGAGVQRARHVTWRLRLRLRLRLHLLLPGRKAQRCARPLARGEAPPLAWLQAFDSAGWLGLPSLAATADRPPAGACETQQASPVRVSGDGRAGRQPRRFQRSTRRATSAVASVLQPGLARQRLPHRPLAPGEVPCVCGHTGCLGEAARLRFQAAPTLRSPRSSAAPAAALAAAESRPAHAAHPGCAPPQCACLLQAR